MNVFVTKKSSEPKFLPIIPSAYAAVHLTVSYKIHGSFG